MTSTRGRRIELIAAVAVALGTYGWFHVLPHDTFPVGLDNSSEFSRAWDCVHLGECTTLEDNAPGGVAHGPTWTDFLMLVRLLGGGMTEARELLFALYGLTTGTLFLAVRWWLRPALALPTVLFSLCAFPVMDEFHVPLPALLTTASLLFVPCVLYALSLVVFAIDRSEAALTFAAALCAVAVVWHAIGVTLLPGLLVAAILISRHPVWALVRVIAVIVIVGSLISTATLMADLDGQWREGRLPLELAGTFGLVGACAFSRRRVLASTAAVRVGLVMGALILGNSIALVSLWRAGLHVNGYYAVPAAFPWALAAAAVLVALTEAVRGKIRWGETWSAVIPVVVATIALAQLYRPPVREASNAWSFQDGQRIAEALTTRGWSFTEAIDRLQERHCHQLRLTLTPFLPLPDTSTIAHPGSWHLRFWTLPAHSARRGPPGSEVVPLEHGRAAVLSEIDAWLDPAHAWNCPAGRTSGPGCEPLLRALQAPGNVSAAARFWWVWDGAAKVDGRTQVFDVHPTAGQHRQIDFFGDPTTPERGPATCRWRVTGVVGLQVDRPLPSTRVSLYSPDGAPAQVIVEEDPAFPGCPWEQGVPCHIETGAEDVPFLADREGDY